MRSPVSPTPPAAPVSSVDVPPQMTEALSLVARIGGQELVNRVTQLFNASAAERLVNLRKAVDAGELTQVKRLAHAMKGSAAQVGAETVRAIAHDLEKGAESMSVAATRDAIDALEQGVSAAYEQLESARRQGEAA